MEEYKGIYYGDEVEQKYYEGGAHFKYNKLYKILEKIAKERNIKEKKKEWSHINKSNNLNKSPKKYTKKTRNYQNYLDNIKLSFKTIGNNYTLKKDKYHKNLFLSIYKENNKEDINNNYSLSKHKKEIDSRNKDSVNAYRGRPNTIFKDRFKNMVFPKKIRIMSSSVEQKKKKKSKNLIDLKKSVPEFNSNNVRKIKNYSTHQKQPNFNELGLNYIRNDKNINKIEKNNNIRDIMKIDILQSISYSNNNNINLKTERINQPSIEMSHKKLIENYTEVKDSHKKPKNLFINNIKISEKTHDIINKRIICNKNSQIHMKSNTLISYDKLNKSKIDKDNNNAYINKSNKKKKIIKDFHRHNKTFHEKTNFKNNKYYSLLKEANKNNKENTYKKDNYKNYVKIENNLFSFNNKLNKKSRNEKGNNIFVRSKNTFNNNNKVHNKNKAQYKNDKSNNYYKTMLDMNKTYNFKTNDNSYLNKSHSKHNSKLNYKNINKNFTYKSNKKKGNNNEISISTNFNEASKKRRIIDPYLHLSINNKINNKSGINGNGNSRVHKRKTNQSNTNDISKKITII